MPPGMKFKGGIPVKHALVPYSAQVQFEDVFGGPVMMFQAGFANLLHGRYAEHLWCCRCKRAFPNGTYRQVGAVRRCPYADCGGHSIVDAMDWAVVRGMHVDYPYTPQLGTKYP